MPRPILQVRWISYNDESFERCPICTRKTYAYEGPAKRRSEPCVFPCKGVVCAGCSVLFVSKEQEPIILLYRQRDSSPRRSRDLELLKKIWAKETKSLIPVEKPPKIPSTITEVGLLNEKGTVYHITIVDDFQHQNSSRGVYWRGRGNASAVLNGIISGRERVVLNIRRQELEFVIKTYTRTPLLDCYFQQAYSFSDQETAPPLFIYQAKTPCPTHPDAVECVTAFVPSTNSYASQPLSVNYCTKCDRYYINSTSFNLYAEQYGMPLVKLQSLGGGGNGIFEFQEESILHFLGYNVGMAEDLSTEARQRILTQAIAAGIIKKPKVVSFLESMIRRNDSKPQMRHAISKWKQDLLFVCNLNIEKQKQVFVIPTTYR